MLLSYAILCSAFLLAICTAYFSVSGISSLFSASNAVSIIILAIALEISKVVSISYLYRFWNTIPIIRKSYLTVATCMVAGITSLGVYGFLSTSYYTSSRSSTVAISSLQTTDTALSRIQSQRVDNTNQLTRLLDIEQQYQNRIDSLLARTQSVASTQRQLNQIQLRIEKLQQNEIEFTTTLDSLYRIKQQTTERLNTGSKLGTFYYVAAQTNLPINTIVQWFIIILVIVSDPMSIMLFIAYQHTVEPKSSRTSTTRNLTSTSDDDIITESKMLDSTPYYMDSSYDWNTETAWKTDPNAVGYYSQLGYRK